MSFSLPFHDGPWSEARDALLARLEAVVAAAPGGHLDYFGSHPFLVAGVWSPDGRPVALVGLGYDWVNVQFAGGNSTVRLSGVPLEQALGEVESTVRRELERSTALGPRALGEASGDDPSSRAARDAASPGVTPGEWASTLLDRVLLEAGFGPGGISMPPVLAAVTRWLAQSAPRTAAPWDVISFELFHWTGDGSTACAEPPASLAPGEWIGVGFGRDFRAVTDDAIVTSGGHGLQLWFPPDAEWHTLLPTLQLKPEAVVTYAAYGLAGSWSPWLTGRADVRSILAVVERKQPALAVRWSGDRELQIPGTAAR